MLRSVRYEVPFTARSPVGAWQARPYPLQLGQVAPADCPSRPLWWLLVAFGVGVGGGYLMRDQKKPRGRRG